MKLFLLILINFIINSYIFSQDEWVIYDEKKNESMFRKAGGIEPDGLHKWVILDLSQYNAINSVCFLRKQSKAYWDKIVVTANGFFILIFNNTSNPVTIYNAILIKTNSKAWSNFARSIVPDSGNRPITSPKRESLTSSEQLALSKLMDEAKGIYCKFPDAVSDSLIALFKKSDAVEFEELEKLENEAKVKKMSEEQKLRFLNGVPNKLRLIVYEDGLLGVDPKDGRAYFEIQSNLQGKLLAAYKDKIIKLQGIDFENKCETFVGCRYYEDNGRIETGKVIPTSIAVSNDVKRYYGFNTESLDKKEETNLTKSIGVQIFHPLLNFEIQCPPNLIDFPVILEGIDANTYLVSASENSDLNEWFMFTGKACFKCGGIDQSMIAEVFSSTSNISVKILKTSSLKALTSREDSPEKVRLISSLRKSFKMAESGQLLNNTIDFLGEGGLVYKMTTGQKAITVDNTTMTYNGGNVNAAAFNEWLGYFDRVQRKVKAQNSEAIVNQLFEAAASGKVNWFKEYRQNPLVFLSKYCETERP